MRRMGRREFLRVAGGALATAALPELVCAEQTWSSGMERPAFSLPEGAVDCHMHIYDDRFPVAPGTTLRPPNASVAQYRLLQERLGVKRNVVVTPSTYGTDNRCTLEALRQFGSNARGVAVVDNSVSDAELRQLDSGGIRAIRFNLSYPGAATLEMLAPLAGRIANLGWHIELVVQGSRLPALERHLSVLPCPLVEAHAQAEAQKLLQQTITPEIIQQQAVAKWDGHLPEVLGSSGVLPMLGNLGVGKVDR